MSVGPANEGTFAAVTQALQDVAGGASDERGIWQELSAKLDPAEFRPALSPDVEVKTFRLRWGNDYAMVANPRDLVHYQLEPADAELLQLMDGSRTVREIVVERLRDSGDMELSSIADLVQQLRVEGFLASPYVDVSASVRRALDPVSVAREKGREFVKTLSIDWRGAQRMVAWLYRHGLRWCFLPAVVVAMGLVAVTGFAAFLAAPRSVRVGLSGSDAVVVSLLLLLMNYALTFVHELAHATALVHYGRRVKSAGFMIYFGSPAFFIESSDGLMMERGQRIVQSFAGPFAELVVAGAAAIFAWAAPDSGAAPLLHKFALLNYLVILLNLVPLLELDGYWVLADLIQVPDLRPRSLQFIQYDLWRKLRRRERFTKQEVGLGLYGVLGIAFTVFAVWTAIFFWEEVFGGLVREIWAGGPVARLLLVAFALFIGGPVLRGLISLTRALVRRVHAVDRAVRFRLQTGWRVEAAHLIDALPLFEDLPEDVLSDLAGRVQLREFPAGKSVFRQGDRADAFFVIRTGAFHVVEEDPETGTERVLHSLGRGDSFGELALVDRSPRTATVRAAVESQVFVVDRATFDRLLSDMADVPEFAPTLQAVAELRQLPAYAGLGSDDLAEVLGHGRWVNVPPGETVIEQGEVGDAFYTIRAGQVEVRRDGELVDTLGAGAYFGEIALLTDVPRTATVVARTPVRLFRLDREGFERVISDAFRRGTLEAAAQVDRTWKH